jgi:DNA mismatch repair protein MutL
MMGKIAVLGDNMVNVIAAGEVVERPASVLKELLENSIDAGAKSIIVTIEDGGLELISVTDDGSGMAGDDLAMAFQRHATSKIHREEDLERIATMGFRGEALASIAAVAQVRAVSRMADSVEAACIEIDCGVMAPVRPCSGSVGTTIEVRKLFYKLPARRKFLRTANTEMKHITEHFTRIALSHCQLDMTLVHNGREICRLTASQPARDRIRELLSEGIAEDLVEFASQEKGLNIKGLLGRPAAARTSNKYQYVFLNGRFIRDKFISHAMQEAYRGMMEPGKFPVAAVWIEMPFDAYDVNVHPMKMEVRFYDSNLVHSQVLGAMREKLMSLDLDVTGILPGRTAHAGPLSSQDLAGEDAGRKERIAQAMTDFFQNHKGMQQQPLRFTGSTAANYPSAPRQSDSGYSPPAASGAPSEPAELPQMMPKRRFLQLHDSYIVTEVEDGFMIVDQHALHERIIYEELCRKLNEGELESQKLLIPETFEVTTEQADALDSHGVMLEKLGIIVEPFGPRTVAIQAFPAMLDKVEPVEFVQGLLDLAADKELGIDEERLMHEVLDMAACKAAIKAGQRLSEGEIAQLLADKERVERSSRCPHGRPTVIKLSLADLEKQFKRTGF